MSKRYVQRPCASKILMAQRREKRGGGKLIVASACTVGCKTRVGGVRAGNLAGYELTGDESTKSHPSRD